MSSECVFCKKIEAGEDEHGKVHRTALGSILRFEPLNPVTEGHMLFVPALHFEMAYHRPVIVSDAVYALVTYAAQMEIESYNIIQSNGAPATQTVPHVHVHLVPRRERDDLTLPWTPTYLADVHYRTLTEDGKLWVESGSLKEVLSRSVGAPGPVTYQKLEARYVYSDWQDWDPEEGR